MSKLGVKDDKSFDLHLFHGAEVGIGKDVTILDIETGLIETVAVYDTPDHIYYQLKSKDDLPYFVGKDKKIGQIERTDSRGIVIDDPDVTLKMIYN